MENEKETIEIELEELMEGEHAEIANHELIEEEEDDDDDNA